MQLVRFHKPRAESTGNRLAAIAFARDQGGSQPRSGARARSSDRAWLAEKYPRWEASFASAWDRIEGAWATQGEAGTLAYALPALCTLCQLPAVFVRPGANTACTLETGGRRYLFCSDVPVDLRPGAGPLRRPQELVDRIVAGEAPGKLTDLHRWMGLESAAELGGDLRRGLDRWRLDPVPTA